MSDTALKAHIDFLESKYNPSSEPEGDWRPPADEEDLHDEDIAPGYEQRLQEVAVRVFSDPIHFDMDYWEEREGLNDCDTTRCMAGWAVTLAGEQGKRLHQLFNEEWGVAGAVLLGREAAEHFGDSNRNAYVFLRNYLPADSLFSAEPKTFPSVRSL